MLFILRYAGIIKVGKGVTGFFVHDSPCQSFFGIEKDPLVLRELNH